MAVAPSHPGDCYYISASIRPKPKKILVNTQLPACTYHTSQARRRVHSPHIVTFPIHLTVHRLKITFVTKDGERHTFDVCEGDNLLDIAAEYDLDMEGACEGSCSCSTCHVIVEDGDMFDKMEEATDEENDMLDLAFGLTETSRLGCQVKMTKELDGLVVRLPSMTRNLQASDFAQK
jgi:ferredoxin